MQCIPARNSFVLVMHHIFIISHLYIDIFIERDLFVNVFVVAPFNFWTVLIDGFTLSLFYDHDLRFAAFDSFLLNSIL